MNCVCVDDYEKLAQSKLPKEVFSYYRSGAQDELSLKKNRQAFDERLLVPRMFEDVDNCSTVVHLFSLLLSMPLIIAPMAFHRLVNSEGELATVRAAKEQQVGMVLSTMSTFALEDVASEYTEGLLWFQLYMYKDRGVTQSLIERAEKAGFKAIVLTVDVPVMGRRYDDMRYQFNLPLDLIATNIPEEVAKELSKKGIGSSIKKFTDQYFKRSITLKDIEWIKSVTNLPVIVKGILHPQDAIEAIKVDVDGLIISNHGGRQLDTAIASLDALPTIKKEVQNKVPIILDGGIRRGVDILKALALGADAISIGRPILWGLASHGQQGVCKILDLLHTEFVEAMMMCGFSSIAALKQQNDLFFPKK